MSKNQFTVYGDYVNIFRPGWPKMAFATIREDYIDELKSVTWSVSGAYLRNKKLGALHRYIVAKWYGQNLLDEMTESGFIVDHMDNNGFDCRIENLYFLAKRENTAKGQTLDIQIGEMRPRIALNIFRDFSTELFQITMFFNESAFLCIGDKTVKVSVVKLLYDTNYKIVIADAKSILDHFELSGRVDFTKLHQIDIKIEQATYVTLTPDEAENGAVIVQRDGKCYLIIRETARVNSINYDKGWKPYSNNIQEEKDELF